MEQAELERVVKNLNDRVLGIEQILPTLATKEDLTRAIREAVEPLATRAEMREEGERTRRHFDAVAERLESQIRMIAEGYGALREELTAFRAEVKGDFAGVDRRLMRLEVSR